MVPLESKISAASLNSLAASTSALAEITLLYPTLFYLAAAAISSYNSLDNTISFINTFSI